MSREERLVRTFIELTDILVARFDVVEVLTLLADRCVELLDVSAAGVMLASAHRELRVVASSSDAMRVLELFELQTEEGPCPECFRTGDPVASPASAEIDARWPQFGLRAADAGFQSVQALPMSLQEHRVGALNLFRISEGRLAEADVIAAQAFADVATIALLQRRAAADAQVVNEQLTNALNSRIVIEQAKGMVAERMGLDMEQAFNRIRSHARNRNLRLVDVARSVIEGDLVVHSLEPANPGEGVAR
jgi:transcriptional regulator with GAF, ATPase, and Fis domain